MLHVRHETIKAEAVERHRNAALYRQANAAKKQRRARARTLRKQWVWEAKRQPRPVWRPSTAR